MGTTKTNQISAFGVSEVNSILQKKMQKQWSRSFFGVAVFWVVGIIAKLRHDDDIAFFLGIIGLVLLAVAFYLMELHSSLANDVNAARQHVIDVEEEAEVSN